MHEGSGSRVSRKAIDAQSICNPVEAVDEAQVAAAAPEAAKEAAEDAAEVALSS